MLARNHDSRKRQRYFATSANQRENCADLSAINKTAEDGIVNTVRGKTKKEKG
jgi:hypothetical protein